MKNRFLTCILFLILVSSPLISFASPFDTVVIFGDSLSDNGNLYEETFGLIPDSSEYFMGRFSNGPVWVEYLADSSHLDADLVNYAHGGATTDSLIPLGLEGQVLGYVTTSSPTPDTLCAIWIGANDVFNSSPGYDGQVDDHYRLSGKAGG